MEKIKGIKLLEFPLRNLRKITDLIYFDGPLLSHFKDENNDSYFFYWCDVDENYNRWLVFRVGNVDNYLTGKISLRELIQTATDIYSVDIDNDLQYYNVFRIPQDLVNILEGSLFE